MGRAVVHDPEDAASVVIGRSSHHLFHQAVERCDAIVRLATAKDSGVMYVQCSDIGPGAAAEVFVFDTHGSVWTAVLCRVLAAAGLNAGLFVGGNDELVLL